MSCMDLKSKLEVLMLANKKKLSELKAKADADIQMINSSYDKFIQSIPCDPRSAPEGNEWFERGELPPVGATVEFTWGSKSEWYECVIIDSNTVAYKWLGDWRLSTLSNVSSAEFRPIRTEREKAIQAAVMVSLKVESWQPSCFAEALYDAGLLRLPEDKK